MEAKFILLNSNLRNLNYYDWGTYLLIFCVIMIAFIFTYQSQRFLAMIQLPVSDKYLRVFDEQPLNSVFNASGFLLKTISFSFGAYFFLLKFQLTKSIGFNLYLQLFTAIFVFNVAKIIIEKMIFNIFDIENLFEKTIYNRFSYANAFGLLFLPVHFVVFYNTNFPDYITYIYFGIIAFGLLFKYFVSLLHFFNLLLKHHIYFILYICTLEIAPLVFIYHLVVNSSFL